MLYDQLEAHLQAAAAEVFTRIESQARVVPPKLRPALVFLRGHLFEPGLQVWDLKRACGIRDNSFASFFRSAVGQTPKAFLTDCRMEVAKKLLARTEIAIGRIGERIGYGSLHSFSKAFQDQIGLRPGAYRRQERARDHGDWVEDQSAEEQWWPDIDEPWKEDAKASSSEVEAAVAEATWVHLRALSPQEAEESLHRHRELCTPALADLLRRQARIAGRTSRRRCVEISELALSCVQGYRSRWRTHGAESVRELAHLEARIWIWLGNAHRLGLDLLSAAKVFAVAAEQMPEQLEPQVLAEFLGYLGALRWYQLRLREGIEVETRAIGLFRLLEQRTPLAEALLTLGGLHLSGEDAEASVPRFEEGLQLLDKTHEPALVLGGRTMLTRAYLALGRKEAARQCLLEALDPARRLGKLRGLRHLQRILF